MSNQTIYQVKIANPHRGIKETHPHVSAEKIDFENMTYHAYGCDCPILEISEVSQSYLDAKLAYFKRYGTANE